MLLRRQIIPELMDAPGLDARAHDEALAGLRILNQASRAPSALARPILQLAKQRRLTRLSLLDVACGGGDVPLAVARSLAAAGVAVDLALTDRSPTALSLAASAARAAGFEPSAIQGDAPQNLPQGSWDVVTSTLFLHHLARADAVDTLAQMARRAKLALVVGDLRRGIPGFALAWLMCRLLTPSRIVRHDGPVSVRTAWSLAEMRSMAAEAGLTGATVRPSWPLRMLLIWRRPP